MSDCAEFGRRRCTARSNETRKTRAPNGKFWRVGDDNFGHRPRCIWLKRNLLGASKFVSFENASTSSILGVSPTFALFFLTSCCGSHYAGSRRARRSSGPARPYIVRLSAFKRLICPSVWPLLHGSVIAFLTALMSLCAVRAKRCIA